MGYSRKRKRSFLVPIDRNPVESAQRAGLLYVSDEVAGIQRKRCGRGFLYLDSSGKRVSDPEFKSRIRSLIIPPAWQQVWICPHPKGHLQATGRDEKGRKQYLYHPDWHQARSETKFNRMVLFGQALPHIRMRCADDLTRQGLPREKVLATVTTLLDRTRIRIGNTEYARQNKSFGLTTLRDRHVDISGASLTFTFVGKSGKAHSIELEDRRLARIVRRCKEVPGYELFQYIDRDGSRHPIGSGDVNAYLKEITGQDFTAKDFRTWGGTMMAARSFAEMDPASSEREARRNVASVIKRVSAILGNTTTVCRKYYVHPALIHTYMEGTFSNMWRDYLSKEPIEHLEPEESALLHFLIDQN